MDFVTLYRITKLKNGCTPYPYPMEMKDRIFDLMKQEGLNQKEFAIRTGISPATLSSIFNGRTSPTLNHAQALHIHFPKLSMPWLMFGEGEMYVKDKAEGIQDGDGREGIMGDMFGALTSAAGYADSGKPVASGSQSPHDGTTPRMPYVREVVKYVDKPQRRITGITIFFDDGSFETFPGKMPHKD